MRRLTFALLVALGAAVTLGGCFGPINDRLYVSEWKSKKEHPIPVYRGWTYQGEHWEHVVYEDGPGNRP